MISTKKKTAVSVRAQAPEPTAEAVAQRAYEKFQARGGVHGNDLQDWLEAEQELKTRPSRGRN